MRTLFIKKRVLLSFLFIFSLLAACGTNQSGTSPVATSAPISHGDQPPILVPTPTPAPVVGLGKDYAFIRNNQVWVARNGTHPVQATHFTQILSDNVYWSQPRWFDNDRFLVFTLKVLNYGIGGAGCALSVGYSRGDQLFVLNTSTLKLNTLTVPGEKPATLDGATPYIGHWDSLFREDDTHLLAWDEADGTGANSPSSQPGLYRYDLATNTLTLAIPATSVPGANNNQAMHPMRYSHGQLFYETMTPVDDKRGFAYTIYSHSLTDPAQPSVKILDVGREVYCTMGDGPNGPFIELGWDVSPDGTHLVAQTLVGEELFASDMVHVISQIRLVTLQDGASKIIFQQVSPKILTFDVALTWGPDSQTVLLEAGLASSQGAIYTTTVVNTAIIQPYAISSVGQYGYYTIIWNASSTAFALPTYNNKLYLFTVGKPESKLLLDNANKFAWGMNQ